MSTCAATPGVWSAHENWHCAILMLHLTELYALIQAS